MLKNIIEKLKAKKERYQEVELEYDAHHKLEEKHKDANERELERYYEEMHKSQVKRELERFRKKKQDEIWRGNMFTKNKNLFKNNKFKLGVQKIR